MFSQKINSLSSQVMKNAGVWRFPAYSTCKKKKSARIWSFCLKWQEKKTQLNDRQNTKRVNHALRHPQSIWIQCQKFLNPSKSPTLYSSEFSVGKDIWVPVNSGFKSSFVLWFRIRCIWFQMNFWIIITSSKPCFPNDTVQAKSGW